MCSLFLLQLNGLIWNSFSQTPIAYSTKTDSCFCGETGGGLKLRRDLSIVASATFFLTVTLFMIARAHLLRSSDCLMKTRYVAASSNVLFCIDDFFELDNGGNPVYMNDNKQRSCPAIQN